ncbi:signal peptidase II [Rhizobium sp. L1K21]|uniref:signal peptidase II n=1 Tax=Rhizobium sp. L1K21 TaxID=2954933 RepID=UPI0020923CAF|nr:signal peptidase II [Rhizobium sp. L1K21]MCO6187367.1 signal peptidase II [Rhizobium sp. L1K21]
MTAKPALFSRPIPAILLIVIALVADQASKIAVDHLLPLQQPVPFVPFIDLYRTYNTGVAFSMFDDFSGWIIVGVRLAIVAFVLWLWRRTDAHRWLYHLGFALVVAGAIGNLIDRFAYGHVVDFILFHTQSWSFAVFNLADSYITVGAIIIAFEELFRGEKTDS